MNPDVFQTVPLPQKLEPFFRRAMVACAPEPVDMALTVRGTGYSYLGWTAEGRWTGNVNDSFVFDTEQHGPLHLSGQVYDGHVQVTLTGRVRQIFLEFTALGQYEFLGVPGSVTFEEAMNPIETVPALEAVNAALSKAGSLNSVEEIAAVLFDALDPIAPAAEAPAYLHRLVEAIEESHGSGRFSDLVRDAPVSERKARDDFAHLVGLSPKRFSKLLQINYAFGALLGLGEQKLAEIALECGFSDQAHMTRSFVAFLGDSPVRFAQDIEPTLKQFVGHSRRVNKES